ncbi:MAG TPA: hypothetical protein VF513_12915 [Stenotrophomonas sp.]|uniref:hypothetical protein n=1 Tax=Stenotrophomonas pigmentata TaxID=3055080 RepID=UPI0026ECF240|nr:hypothetical protein [Stenotrophomonas sp. 610A2]
MKNTMRVLLAASMVLAVTACKKEEAPVVEAQQALVAPAKDDDAGWKKYLQAVAVQNMGNITASPFLYYLPPASDPEFAAKYDRQVESATTAIGRGIQPGNMLAFGSSNSAKMGDLIETGFKDVQADSMKGVRVVFIGDAADNARVQTIVKPTGADYIFVEAK